MEFLQSFSSAPMFFIAGVVVLFILLFCVVMLVKSYRGGLALGMDKTKLRRAITSSATFTVLPSVSILLGVIALSGSLGIPLPWLRLSVVGALHYEGNVADIAARAAGQPGGLGSGTLTPSSFVTIALVMTMGIFAGSFLCLFFVKKYLAKVQKTKAKESGQLKPGKPSFADVAFSAMFIGLVSAYIGSYLGTGTSAGNWVPMLVALIAALAMGVFEYFARVKKIAWLDNFSMACSMMIGMGAAVLTGIL